MTTDRLSHRERMLAIAAGWSTSSQTQQTYCESHGLKLCTFSYWLRRYRESQGGAAKPQTGFVELPMFAGGSQLEIHHPNGVVIKAPVQTPSGVLQTLLTPA